ncbi:hypothetical protein [Hyalangium rubrum]|uniref:Uncharacterized protein n=1 Tax=Hyalangium rubrum TaxID=3103134 RepID=A0ABU5HIU3_9BACT|nr:hypothetical protein [Hyalangium sp. s54d21]MDY7233291.1 hypothetical protein [Hyalangium sp. s54d21]
MAVSKRSSGSKRSSASKSTRRAKPAVGAEALGLQLPADVGLKLSAIRLNTVDSAKDEVRTLGLQRAQVAPSVANLFQSSQVRALNFTRGVIANWRDDSEAEQESEPLIQWAHQAGPEQRRMMSRAFRLQGKGALVIHNIGGMPQEDARTFMKDYFEAGGDLDDVAEWFQRAGHVLRTERAQAPGVEFLGAIGDWFKGAVKTVGDALSAAGKSLGDAIGKVVDWTTDKISDFVEGLIAAGRKVAEILTEAAKKGAATVRKFVRGILDAGRSLTEVLAWAAKQVANTVKDVVDEVIKAGRRVAQIVSAVANQVSSVIHATLKALVQLGRQVREIVDAAVNLAAGALEQIFKGLQLAGKKLTEVVQGIVHLAGQTLKRMVEGLYKVFRTAADIVVAFMKDQLSTIRMVLEGLLAAGLQLGQAVTDIVTHVAEQFRKGFFQGLIALGKSPVLIMKAALETAGGVAGLAFATLLDVIGGHRELTAEEKRQARRVYGDVIELSRVKVAVASLPSDLVNLVNGGRPFTTMYVINFASSAEIDMKTLIHELAHVWQGVTSGPVYMVQAIEGQLSSEGYTVTDDMLRERGNDLKKFNREQQAVIAEEFWYEEFGQHEAAYRRLESVGLDVELLRPYAQHFKATRPIVSFPVPKLPIPAIPIAKLPRLSPIRVPAMEAARTARRPSAKRKTQRRTTRRQAR